MGCGLMAKSIIVNYPDYVVRWDWDGEKYRQTIIFRARS